MNFSNHQKELIGSVRSALVQDKRGLCSAFISILKNAGSFYQTKDFEFWIQQIQETPEEEIPVTIYGHQNASQKVENLVKENRQRVQAGIVSISKDLFTYSNENSICPAQSEYHYYYDQKSETVYKESELGFLDGVEYGSEICSRIARVSELNMNPDELYR